MQRPEGIDGVGGSASIQFGGFQPETGLPRDGQGDHVGPHLRWCPVTALFEGLFKGGNEAHFFEIERLENGLGYDQVPVMNGVKGAAKQADHCATGQTSSVCGVPGWNRRR